MNLLKQMCQIHSPSGEEFAMSQFLLNYVQKNQDKWKVKPTLHYGDGLQDNIIMVFGKNPKTAIFAHLDSIGFTVKIDVAIFENSLINDTGGMLDFNNNSLSD